MRDYFAALAARTLQPELGVQPRQRVRWEKVPEPPVDAFAAIPREAIAGAAGPNEPAEGERRPRSNRRSNAEADPSVNEPVARRSGREHTVRRRTTDHDGTKIAASAAMPHPAMRTAEPSVQIRSGRVDERTGHVPAIKRPGIEERRAPAVNASRGTERPLRVPAGLSVRDRDPAASEPAIRIHIGRVDVRAVTAAVPAPPAPRENNRALMSLDEYVQKRDSGRVVSSALAVAAVTAVLKDLLNNGIIANDLATIAGNSVRVTSKPPDLLKTGADEEAGLNLFAYRMGHNTTLRNNSLPAFDSRGDRVSNPPLALDLHYLLMAYGKEEYQAEILMGYAMQLLHETPVLSRQAIQASLSAIPSLQVSGSILPPAYQALAAADLADQIETVKICPDPLGVEDITKLWSAFQANHFRLTAGYTASVVLIQSKKSTRASLPVLKSNLYVMPLKHPRIDEVISAAAPPADVRITSASTILIKGSGLRGAVTRVQIGEATVSPADAGDAQISIDLSTVAGLGAGVQATQVMHDLLMGNPAPGQLHRGFESNVVPFVLHPTITAPASYSLAAGTMTVGFDPAVRKAQRVTLYLYEHNAPDTRPARAYSFPPPKDNGIAGAATTAASIAFSVDIVPGDYLAYASVDGAESPLGLAAGQFDSPRVTVTA